MESTVLPWSETCFVCGDANPSGLDLRFYVEGDEVVLTTELDPTLEGYPGHVHGGIITALLDEGAGWACTAATGRLYVTAELTVRFRAPVPGGRSVTLRASLEEDRKRLAVGRSRLEDGEGRVLAEAEGRFIAVPADDQAWIVPHLKMPGRPARQGDLCPGRGSRENPGEE